MDSTLFFFLSFPSYRQVFFLFLFSYSGMGLGFGNGVWEFEGEVFYLCWRVDELKFEKVGGIYFKWG